MTTLILGNRLAILRRTLEDSQGPIRYLNLLDNPESREVTNYLGKRANATELPKAQLLRDGSEEFRKKYIEFLGGLNARNHSLEWWAMPFTNKNPLATTLCRDTSYFLLVVSLLDQAEAPLLVITASPELVAQLKEHSKRRGFKFVDVVKAPRPYKRFLKRITPVGVIRTTVRTFFLWLMTRRHKNAPDSPAGVLVIATHTHLGSFIPPDGYRDAYFGSLVERTYQLAQRSMVLSVPAEHAFEQLGRIRSLNIPVPVIPLDVFLTFGSLLRATWRAFVLFSRPIRPNGPVEIDGSDLSVLVELAIENACHSGEVLSNLRMNLAAQRLGHTINVSRFLYPFENRSWEKMLVTGLRSTSPGTRVAGYQHASITLSHTNFMLAPGESDITPLPDAILTTGEVTKDWLERKGNYPAGFFKSGCALRQGQPIQLNESRRRVPVTNILAVLATSAEEYASTLTFLERLYAKNPAYQLRVRPHPAIPLDSALDDIPLSNQGFFSRSTGSLAQDLEWAEIALYASSTVGLEAVAQGIPAVYLDLGGILNTDPMLGWSDFRWTVREPNELVETIGLIEAIPDQEFRELQRKGRDYVERYLTPVSESGLRAFMEV